MKTTKSGRKQFSAEEKRMMISECQNKGVKLTCANYGIYPASYYYWKKKLLTDGEEGLNRSKHKVDASKMKAMAKEVQTLKLLLAEEKLASRLKDDLLKKKYPELKK